MKRELTPEQEKNLDILEPGESQLHCPRCGFKHPVGTVAKPICPDCGAGMWISSMPKLNATLHGVIYNHD